MSHELGALLVAVLGCGYLSLLFGIAYLTERGWIPRRLVRHPLVYVLSLGVFAGVWAYYAVVQSAWRDGYGYLAGALGISLAFLFSPLLLRPLLNLTRNYQLGSLADLIAFRYRSTWAGTVSTLVILMGVTPLIALQVRAVADTASFLSPAVRPATVALVFCVIITLFALLFGTSRHSGRSRHDGLVMAIAFESLVKLLAFLVLGLFAVFGVFGGPTGLEEWLQQRPHLIDSLRGGGAGTFHLTALMFFTAAVAMPHLFYVTFTENRGGRGLAAASWGLPLYFLLLSLPVLPVLWAGLRAGGGAPVEYLPIALGLAYEAPALSMLAYLGGLSAASGLIIVITLALSNMCINHIVLPVHQPTGNPDIYRWLQHWRRVLITVLIWTGFLFYYLQDGRIGIEVMGTLAFTATLQFLPGIAAALYWPQGNKKGFMAGLGSGFSIWLTFLILPVFAGAAVPTLVSINWHDLALLSLLANIAVFAAVSRLSRTNDEERSAADACVAGTINRRRLSGLVAKSPEEFIESLSRPLGGKTAAQEVGRALTDLKINMEDRRPYAMRLLRARLEANLSGLFGPAMARRLVDGYLPFSHAAEHGSWDPTIIENRLEAYRRNLSGMAADLDNLRRYHRQILLDLPLGVCSLTVEGEILMWNRAMADLTGITADHAIGLQLSGLPKTWRQLLSGFMAAPGDNAFKHRIETDGRWLTVNLHKARIAGSAGRDSELKDLGLEGMIILLEDITETALLEAGLAHSERLASIGRLAAGVAHEIGNPVTGIACLAQTIRDEYREPGLNTLARQIIEETERTSKILQTLMHFAHIGRQETQPGPQRVDIAACMEEARTLATLDKKARAVDIRIRCQPRLCIRGDSQRLVQVILNLITNARDASPEGAEILLQGEVEGEATEAGRVTLSVTDPGVGVPAAIRDRVFDPFFTTKEPGAGTGLGLSLAFSIVEDMGGDIDIISPVDKTRGTQVLVQFPRCDCDANKGSL